MSHSNFKVRSHTLNSGVEKCSCGQTFELASETEWSMKIRMQCKVCPRPPEASMPIKEPKKAMTSR